MNIDKYFREKDKNYPYIEFSIFEDDYTKIITESPYINGLKWEHFIKIFVNYINNGQPEFNKFTEDYINQKLEHNSRLITKHFPIDENIYNRLNKTAKEQKITLAYLALKICISHILNNEL